MRLIILSALVIAATSSPTSAQFAMDMSPAELRKSANVMGVADLAIEETGLVVYPRFCSEDGILFLDANVVLDKERSVYGLNFRIQRKQGNKVVVEVDPGEKTKDKAGSMAAILRIAIQMRCDHFGIGSSDRFEVTSLNGKGSAKAVVEGFK